MIFKLEDVVGFYYRSKKRRPGEQYIGLVQS